MLTLSPLIICAARLKIRSLHGLFRPPERRAA
jgi:hypothetical protein